MYVYLYNILLLFYMYFNSYQVCFLYFFELKNLKAAKNCLFLDFLHFILKYFNIFSQYFLINV